jgi:hypothetical protein
VIDVLVEVAKGLWLCVAILAIIPAVLTVVYVSLEVITDIFL